jgi:hypothetical protein
MLQNHSSNGKTTIFLCADDPVTLTKGQGHSTTHHFQVLIEQNHQTKSVWYSYYSVRDMAIFIKEGCFSHKL